MKKYKVRRRLKKRYQRRRVNKSGNRGHTLTKMGRQNPAGRTVVHRNIGGFGIKALAKLKTHGLLTTAALTNGFIQYNISCANAIAPNATLFPGDLLSGEVLGGMYRMLGHTGATGSTSPYLTYTVHAVKFEVVAFPATAANNVMPALIPYNRFSGPHVYSWTSKISDLPLVVEGPACNNTNVQTPIIGYFNHDKVTGGNRDATSEHYQGTRATAPEYDWGVTLMLRSGNASDSSTTVTLDIRATYYLSFNHLYHADK